jgi:hypothetical protein
MNAACKISCAAAAAGAAAAAAAAVVTQRSHDVGVARGKTGNPGINKKKVGGPGKFSLAGPDLGSGQINGHFCHAK